MGRAYLAFDVDRRAWRRPSPGWLTLEGPHNLRLACLRHCRRQPPAAPSLSSRFAPCRQTRRIGWKDSRPTDRAPHAPQPPGNIETQRANVSELLISSLIQATQRDLTEAESQLARPGMAASARGRLRRAMEWAMLGTAYGVEAKTNQIAVSSFLGAGSCKLAQRPCRAGPDRRPRRLEPIEGRQGRGLWPDHGLGAGDGKHHRLGQAPSRPCARLFSEGARRDGPRAGGRRRAPRESGRRSGIQPSQHTRSWPSRACWSSGAPITPTCKRVPGTGTRRRPRPPRCAGAAQDARHAPASGAAPGFEPRRRCAGGDRRARPRRHRPKGGQALRLACERHTHYATPVRPAGTGGRAGLGSQQAPRPTPRSPLPPQACRLRASQLQERRWERETASNCCYCV